ncbi:MAG: NnrS family protein [Jhaorihella sp.]
MAEVVKRLFSDGFRVFFLAAGLFAVFAGIVWGLWLGVHAMGGMWSATPYGMAPHLWHAHEMVFGYAAAALGGFFLTAVPTWTGGPGARPGFIAAVALIWFAGRLAMWYSASLAPWVVGLVDLAFLPVLASQVAASLMRRPKPQNVMFLGFLLLLWLSNLMVHLEWTGLSDDSAANGLRAGLLTLGALISTLGGRIIPAFSGNAMQIAGAGDRRMPRSVAPLDRGALILSLALPVTLLAGLPAPVSAVAALLLGAVQFGRLSGWRAGWAMRQPILFALHLGFGMLALGLILWGAAGFGLGSEVAALHVLGIGAVGGMTVAVMSRATLAHGGRELVAPGPLVLAYGLIAGAAAVRWLGSTLPAEWYFPAMVGASVLWSLAFALYLASLWPALVGKSKQLE